MDLLELPLTLVVKAPNQKIADTTVECDRQWTIKKLKEHLSDVYPSKPHKTHQRIIYSGKLLQDHLVLKDILRHFDPDQTTHTVHLVCSSSVDSGSSSPSASPSSSTTSVSSSSSSSMSSHSESSSPDGLRQRHTAPSPQPDTATTADATHPVYGGMNMAAAADPLNMNQLYGGGMGAAMPAMMPGVYSPEQMMWLQQMYAQQMAQYMQYMQQGYVAGPEPDVVAGTPGAEPAAAEQPENQPAAAAARPANNQQIRMNAQGGPVMDDDEEEGNRDWLDWVYTFSRFGVLVSILYFYSTLSRFIIVFGLFFMIYLYQAGWLRLRRRNEQQEQQPQQQQEQQQQQPPAQPQEQPQAEPPPPPPAEQEDAGEDQTEDQAEDQAEDQEDEQTTATAAVEPPRPSSVQVAWSFVSSFFTSLMPQQPPVVNAN